MSKEQEFLNLYKRFKNGDLKDEDAEVVFAILMEERAQPWVENWCQKNRMPLLATATSIGNYRAVEILLSEGRDPNENNIFCRPPLVLAAEKGFSEILSLLLRNGANPNGYIVAEFSPLIRAAMNGQQKIVSQLLPTADVHKRDNKLKTLLSAAVENGCEMLIKPLIQRGADIDHVDGEGYTPLIRAIKKGYYNIVSSLVEHGANVRLPYEPKEISPLQWAIEAESLNYDPAIVRLLIKRGAEVNRVKQEHPWWPLMVAATFTEADRALLLLAEGKADPNIQRSDGTTPLFLAVQERKIEVVKVLLEHGANPRLRRENGRGPLGETFKQPNDLTTQRIAAMLQCALLDRGLQPKHQGLEAHVPELKRIFTKAAEKGVAGLSVNDMRFLTQTVAASAGYQSSSIEAFNNHFEVAKECRTAGRRELNQKAVEKIILENIPAPGDVKRHIASYIGADDLPAKWRLWVHGGEQQGQAVAGRTL